MKKLLVSLLMFVGVAYAQTPPIVERTFGDDTYVHVPLQFGFPFYGRTFTNSWMHSNGVVSFLDPAVPIEGVGHNPAAWAYCCEGIRPTVNTPQFSYMIAPLWTDLYPVGQSRFRTQGDSTFQRYYWENIAEISNMNNLNTFGLEIRPSGFIGSYYSNVNIQNQNTWIGTIGDPRLNEWNEIYYGRGIVPGTRSDWHINETIAGDECLINPLSSPTCAGYTTAMCSANPLYSPTCAEYAAAYYSQQCSINTLYDPGCPGYAQAYLNYQCSIDSLYSPSCPGYAQAYFNQQCTLDPLYNNQCPGYADAFYVQQCNINPLYDTGCTGYASAYHAQQCSLNSLYSSTCPGYTQAYFDQQCSLNGLYDRQCPNYAQAYAAQQLLNPPASTQPVVVAQTETSSTPAVVSDPTVNEVITTTATSASPAQAATATVPLAPAPAPASAVVATVEKKEETKDDTSKSTSSDTTSTSTASSSNKKDEPKSTRQQLAERRLEAARAKAVEEGKNLANKVGEAATMEAQVAVQNVVLQAMGFTPGFDAYGKAFIPDGVGYKPFIVYPNQKNVDNARMMRGLTGASDRTHAQMVDSQYK
jgi:hypothetical protein